MIYWMFVTVGGLFLAAAGAVLLARTGTAGFYDRRRIREARAAVEAGRAERAEIDRTLAGIDTAETRAALTAAVAELVVVTSELRAASSACHRPGGLREDRPT
jgi:hypothetical protein